MNPFLQLPTPFVGDVTVSLPRFIGADRLRGVCFGVYLQRRVTRMPDARAFVPVVVWPAAPMSAAVRPLVFGWFAELFVCFAASLSIARAAAPEAPESAVVNPAPPQELTVHAASWLTTVEQNLSIAVLGFGIVVLLIQFVTLHSVTQSNPELVIRAYAVTLIVVCTLFLVSAGLSTNQIAPAIGLFGTIAGYLLGRAGRPGGDSGT